MAERLNKLLSVKSIVTLCLTVVFCVLAVTGVINGQEFLTVFTTVIAFYYGTQSEKRAKAVAENIPVEAITEHLPVHEPESAEMIDTDAHNAPVADSEENTGQ